VVFYKSYVRLLNSINDKDLEFKKKRKRRKERNEKKGNKKKMGDSLNDRASLNSLRYIHRSPMKKMILPLSLLNFSSTRGPLRGDQLNKDYTFCRVSGVCLYGITLNTSHPAERSYSTSLNSLMTEEKWTEGTLRSHL